MDKGLRYTKIVNEIYEIYKAKMQTTGTVFMTLF